MSNIRALCLIFKIMADSEKNGILALAPAAGTGIGKELAERLLKRPDFMQLLEDAAVSALTAMQNQRWNPVARQWEPPAPDAKTRLAALLGLMAQLEGDPVKRIVHQHLGDGGALDLHAVLKDSAELRELLQREVNRAKGPGERSKDYAVRRRQEKEAVPAELVVEE